MGLKWERHFNQHVMLKSAESTFSKASWVVCLDIVTDCELLSEMFLLVDKTEVKFT